MIAYGKGATAYEFQIYYFWFCLLFPKFWRTSGILVLRWAAPDREDGYPVIFYISLWKRFRFYKKHPYATSRRW